MLSGQLPAEVAGLQSLDGIADAARLPRRLELQATVDRLGDLQNLGVAGASIAIEGASRDQWGDDAHRYAEVFDKFPDPRAAARRAVR